MQIIRKILIVAICTFPVIFCSGCFSELATWGRKGARAAYGGKSKPYEEYKGDPIALATTKTIAFIPFENVAPEPGFNSMAFTTRLANQLATKGEFKVIYPMQMMDLTNQENRKVRQHNTHLQELVLMGEDLEKLPRAERTRRRNLNPITNIDDAVKLGRQLKADAVVMGTVTDFDPYTRPRISLSIRLVATGNSDTAAQALAQMAQWGVPRAASNERGVLWYLQQNFDSRDATTGRNVWAYGVTKHTEEHASDVESYIRSMTQYYDYIGMCLSREIIWAKEEAIKEAQRRALIEAEKKRLAQEGVRKRIRALTDPHYEVPDAQAVMNRNLSDQRDMGWRPDIYNLQHPDKKQLLNSHVDPKIVKEQIRAMR